MIVGLPPGFGISSEPDGWTVYLLRETSTTATIVLPKGSALVCDIGQRSTNPQTGNDRWLIELDDTMVTAHVSRAARPVKQHDNGSGISTPDVVLPERSSTNSAPAVFGRRGRILRSMWAGEQWPDSTVRAPRVLARPA